METLRGKEGFKEIMMNNKELRETYLTIGQNAGFFETIQLSNQQVIYKHPSLVEGMIATIDNLHTSYPDRWQSMIPQLTNPAQAKKRMIQQHIKQIQTKKEAGLLNEAQTKVYEQEQEEYNNILAKTGQGDITTIAGIHRAFMPSRRLQAKNDNPNILAHKIIADAIDFLPKSSQSLMQNLNNDNVKQFVETNKEQIKKITHIIETLDIQDPEQQGNMFENLIHCQLDDDNIQKIITLSQSCKQSGDYYELIITITDMFIEGIQKTKTSQNNRIIESILKAKTSIKQDLQQSHERGRKYTITQLTRPNLDIALPGYIHIAEIMRKLPQTKIIDILK